MIQPLTSSYDVRELERTELERQMTVLKSLLRLHADGLREEDVLLAALEETRSAIDRFCLALSLSQLTPRPCSDTPPILSPSPTTSTFSISLPPAPASSSAASSPRSSWQSSPTTSLMSFSPRDSLRSAKSRARPASCLLTFDDGQAEPLLPQRRSSTRKRPISCFIRAPVFDSEAFGSDEDNGVGEDCDLLEESEGLLDGEEDEDDEDESEEEAEVAEETPDESFHRLSSILASLQAQAEAAVGTSAHGEASEYDNTESEGEPEEHSDETNRFWNGFVDEQLIIPRAPPNTLTNRYRRRTHSTPSTPTKRLHSYFGVESGDVTPRKTRRTDVPENLPEDFTEEPKTGIVLCPTPPNKMFKQPHQRSHSMALVHRRKPDTTTFLIPQSQYQLLGKEKRVEGTQGSDGLELTTASSQPPEEWDLERAVAEMLEGMRDNTQNAIFEYVWVWLLGGGVVWTMVGWALGWGCTTCEQAVCPAGGGG